MVGPTPAASLTDVILLSGILEAFICRYDLYEAIYDPELILFR
jgi:hypothetical protein